MAKKQSLAVIAIIFGVGLLLGYLLGTYLYAHFNPCKELPTIGKEVIIKRDTVRVPVPAPTVEPTKKRETVKPVKVDDQGKPVGDTVYIKPDDVIEKPDGSLEIPVERKTYTTDDYKAVVEGWRPNLISMEVYQKTTSITETKLKKPVFSVTLGPGASWDGKEVKPAINLTAGFVLFSR